MDRRQFIQIGTVTILAATPEISAAIESPAKIVDLPIQLKLNPYQHYIDSLRIFDELVVINESGVGEDEINKKCNELLAYMLGNFMDPKGNKAAKKNFKYWVDMNDQSKLTAIRKIPPIIHEGAWLAVMLSIILGVCEMPLRCNKMEHFVTFHNRYRYMILGS